jgi:hypothetical protein
MGVPTPPHFGQYSMFALGDMDAMILGERNRAVKKIVQKSYTSFVSLASDLLQ